jgi:ABC-type multidrug transport system fused ATPase/permease subunit
MNAVEYRCNIRQTERPLTTPSEPQDLPAWSLAPVFTLGRLCKVRRREVLTLIGLTGAGVLCDAAGFGMIYPIGEYLVKEGDMEALLQTSEMWRALYRVFAPFDIEPGVGLVVVLSTGFMVFRQVITYLRLVFQARFFFGVTRKLRFALFQRFLNARLALQERLSSGPFANAMTTESHQAPVAMIMPIELLNATSMMLVYLSIMTWLSPGASLAVVGVLSVVALAMRGLMRRVRELGLAIVAANANFAQHFLQRCRSARLIRLSRSERAEMDQARSLLNDQATHNIGSARIMAITEVGIEPVALIAVIPLMVLAVTIYGAELSLVGMFLLVLARLAPMVKGVVRSWQAFLTARASAEATLALIDEMEAYRELSPGTSRLPSPLASIQFANVSYRYDQAHQAALHHISLRIPGQSMTAIVGPSGSGKSTLIDLIPALRQPDHGEVRLNEVALTTFDLGELRNACAFVSQTPALMAGTIAEQIGYGLPEASEEDIRRAAKMANADGFTEALPDSYETRLGEGGVGLSGGQRQRIELARALVAHAPILILDEPTSSVDGESAHLISQALDRIRAETDATIILVGHHLGTLRHCDHIVVLGDGRVQDQGSHAELMGREGWYRSTFNRQAATAAGDPATV